MPRRVIFKEKKSEMQPIQTQQDQSSGVMEDTMMMKLYWDKPVELFLTVYFVEVVMTN